MLLAGALLAACGGTMPLRDDAARAPVQATAAPALLTPAYRRVCNFRTRAEYLLSGAACRVVVIGATYCTVKGDIECCAPYSAPRKK